jgi:phosphoribosylaminoimidazole carboxylase (NCAIR synthetase)
LYQETSDYLEKLKEALKLVVEDGMDVSLNTKTVFYDGEGVYVVRTKVNNEVSDKDFNSSKDAVDYFCGY